MACGVLGAHGADREGEVDGGDGLVDDAVGGCEVAPPEAGLIVGETLCEC